MGLFTTTVRWNDGSDPERYEAVEVRADGLFWYAWSHVHGRGREREALQSYEAYFRDGPLRALPRSAAAELARAVRARPESEPA
ncbi:MAG: hypothetical protein U0234_12065 [Sandaracinus sp.]